MIRRRSSWLVGVLLCGALFAGCGSSSSSSTSTQSSTPASTASTASTTSSTPASTSTSTSTPSRIHLSGAKLAQAVAICKQQIKAQSTLPAGAKSKLEAVCEKAAKGDTAAVRQAAKEICEEVVNSSKVPAGAAKERALAACKTK